VVQSKVLDFLQFEGTEHYLSWCKYNHCQRRNTESRRQQLSSQLFFRRSWVWFGRSWPLATLPSGSATRYDGHKSLIVPAVHVMFRLIGCAACMAGGHCSHSYIDYLIDMNTQ